MIERLKAQVLNVFGEDLLYTKDCRILAERIYLKTESRISTTTIRRLYGFLESGSAPGKFTLNVLAKYVGFQTWKEFCDHQEANPLPITLQKEDWKEFYDKALNFSHETYNLIVGQSGIPFSKVASRDEAEDRIEQFLKSSKTVTSFIAPGGYGKSTMLAKWFENNWINKQNQDVLFFLNASFMIGFMNNDFKLERWVQDQLRFVKKESLSYFLEHSEDCKGQLIFVIDALDEITYEHIKLERLFLQLQQFILNHKNSSHVKLIITARNSTWEKFALPLVGRGTEFEDCWFDLDEDRERFSISNLKPLSQKEIQEVFDQTINTQYRISCKVQNLSFHQKEMIKNPSFLELFIKLYSPEKQYQTKNSYGLLLEFLKNKVFYSRFSEEKLDILNGILSLTNHGKKGTAVKKIELRRLFPIHLKSAGNYFAAYEQLISFGLLTEYISISRLNTYCKYVRITSELMFETLIGMNLVQQHGKLDFNFILDIEKEYDSYDVKNRLVAFLLSGLISEGKEEDVRRLSELNDDTLSDPNVMEIVLHASLRLKEHRNSLMKILLGRKSIAKQLVDKLILDKHLSEQNKPVVQCFAEESQDKDSRIKFLSLLLMTSLLTLEKEEAKTY